MRKEYRIIMIFYIILFASTLIFVEKCFAQFPIVTLVPQPPIYPYVGDTITAFDSFVWPAGAVVPATSLAAISYSVPGVYSSYPGLINPQIYLSTSWATYLDYLNLYFTSALPGSTLPGAFGPFGLESVNTYLTLGYTYPFFNYVSPISTLITYYALNPLSASYVTAYPLI